MWFELLTRWFKFPIGLTNMPTKFMCIMNNIVNKYLHNFVLVFIYDILVYSKSKEEHEECWAAKEHSLFTFYIPFVTVILSYFFIKPLILTTFIMNMGLYYHFPNHLLLSSLSEFVVNYWEKNNIFSLYFKVGWVLWWLQVYLKTLISSKVTT